MCEELRGTLLHKSTETENKNKNEGREEAQSDLLHDLPDWLQEFRENLVDELSSSELRGNPELGYRDTSSSSHELPLESRAKVEPGSGKHSVYPHFPKNPNCDICFKNESKEGFFQKTYWYSRAQSGKNGDLMTADHKILSRGSESRDNNRDDKIWQHSGYSPTRAKQKLPRRPKENGEFPGAYTDDSLEFGKVLESLYVNTTKIRNKWDC